jgi:hypothetical protein
MTLTSYGKNSEVLNIRIGGTYMYTDPCALKGLVVCEMEACCMLSSHVVK